VELSGYECKPGSEFARKSAKGGKGGGGGRGGDEKKSGAGLTEKLGVAQEQWMDRVGVEGVQQTLGKNYSKRTAESLHRMSHSMINTEMLVALLVRIARELEVVEAKKSKDDKSKQGAVLVFLPGLAEITDLIKAMQENPLLGQANKYLLYPLHSALSTQDQRMVFLTPPVGVTKIVVSTNIAETSVTIDDITVVVDCGTHKEMQYDPTAGMSCLVETRLSKANALQRAGRAGRVRAGSCYHIYLRKEEAEMAAQQLPEMLRCTLESVCLRIKILRLGRIKEFLAQAMEPPTPVLTTPLLSLFLPTSLPLPLPFFFCFPCCSLVMSRIVLTGSPLPSLESCGSRHRRPQEPRCAQHRIGQPARRAQRNDQSRRRRRRGL
jgi:hypothetical protein